MKIKPIIKTPTITIKKATNFKEKYQYNRITAKEFDFSPKMLKLKILVFTLLNFKKNVRILKTNKGEIIGGYQYSMKYNNISDMYIDTLVLKKRKENNYPALKLITKDIKTLAEKNSADFITMIVQKDKPALVDMYKRFGFKEAPSNMLFFKKMFIRVKNFKPFSLNS